MKRGQPKRDAKHTTTTTETHAGFVWWCSCGDYDFKPSSYTIARAGANRHRRYMKELRDKTAAGRP